MISTIEFSKLSGSGNDFICIDNRDGLFDEILDSVPAGAHFARTLCKRGLGVGADGIVFAQKPEIEGVAHIAAKFLEIDGSETFLCGNGTACFTQWACDQGIIGDGEANILTPAGVVRARVLDNGYTRVCIPVPKDMRTDLELEVGSVKLKCDYVVTGIEHVVVYVDDLAAVEVDRLGPALRHHDHFVQPRGVNANFVEVLGEGEIAIRTYEYGVEAETLACGTGSTAAAIMSARRFNWSSDYTTCEKPILIHAPSGDILRVYFDTTADGTVIDPCLETVVRHSYEGILSKNLTALATRKGV
ncbi:MAG: diaminopimelate epimerase [Planctomycetes bacterium]|nr:diaminopimelate epimerase [Planctomycetota bacterium]